MNKEEHNLEFWSNPHRIYYKLYFAVDKHGNRIHNHYRLFEMDDWDEFHQVELLSNVTLENAFMFLDIIGGRELLENRFDWEYGLQP